jgi:two-component system, response regulator PdtaR
MTLGHLSPESGSSNGPPPAFRPGRETADERGLSEGLRGRILVVEDEYFVGLSIESALAAAGFEVLAVVTSGEEALAKFEYLKPQLVLMDIRLAGKIDGIDTAVELRRAGVPSLFASAHSDPGTRARGELAKPVGWITKPFSDAALIEAVTSALKQITSQ